MDVKTQDTLKKITKEISNYFQIQLLEFIKENIPKDTKNIIPFFKSCLDTSKLNLEMEIKDTTKLSNISKTSIIKILNIVYKYYLNLSNKFQCKQNNQNNQK